MKDSKHIRLALIALVMTLPVLSQNENDVLRYSQTDIYGSARVEAMAGSFGALGADISVAQINPAGIGRFSKSDASLSLNNAFVSTSGTYNGTTTRESQNSFVVNSAGVVITNDLSQDNNGRKYGQLTFAYNRLANFNYHKRYEGQNFYSLLDVFAALGAGITPDNIYDQRPFTTGLAYDVYALDYDNSNDIYTSRLTMGDNYHNRDIRTEGGIGEFSIGYSENYMNQLYYGANIGFRRIKYYEQYSHNERLLDTSGTSLRSFNYMYEQQTEGLGVNLKLGLLYLPTQNLRFGFSFESPTFISLEDNWTSDMTATHNDGVKYIEDQYVPTGKYSYNITTPMKLRGSLAYIIGLRGAINVDLEMVRYGQGKLRPNYSANSINPYMFEVENEEVDNQYRSVLNTRIGFEYMIISDVYVRAGYAILPQPFERDLQDGLKINQSIAGGIGWENDWLRVDFAYRQTRINTQYYAFDPSKIENRTEFNSRLNNFSLSAALKL